MSTHGGVDTKPCKNRWIKNHTRRVNYRDHGLRPPPATRKDGNRGAVIMAEPILDSCSRKIRL